MPWLRDLLIYLGIIIIFIYVVYRTRIRLLRMWKEVTEFEVDFHRHFEKVIKLFYENKELLESEEDNSEYIQLLRRYRKKQTRTLLLQTRQKLYDALVVLYDIVEEGENEKFTLLQQEYQELQRIRRVYNSKVLIYNQTISVFPTRYLALRMNLELREYFG